MGISRVASEIQIYSAVYSPVVDRDARALVCVHVCGACMGAHAHSRVSHGWLCIPQDAGLRTLARNSRKSHLFRNKVAYLAYQTDRGGNVSDRQVARVELKCAPRKVFDIFVVRLARGYVYEIV